MKLCNAIHSFLAILLSCTGCQVPESNHPESDNDFATLMVIIDDRSGSTLSYDHPGIEQYEQLARGIKNSGSGILKVIIAGNPKPAHQPTINCILKSKNPIPENATLSERAEIVRNNEGITATNERSVFSFIKKVNEQVIHYQPFQDDDITNLADPLGRAVTILKTPAYGAHHKTLVIVSDGQHEDENGNPINIPLCLNEQELPKIKLYLIGWNKDANCFEGIEHYPLDSFEDLLIDMNFF